MKVVAIIGGLGSQMLKYAFFLQLKETDECYIDTISYRLSDMWNGYELQRIFKIQEKDISDWITNEEIENIKIRKIDYKNVAEKIMNMMDSQKIVVSIFRGYLYPQAEHKILLLFSLLYNRSKRIGKKNSVKDTFPFFYKTKIFSIYYDEFNHTSDYYIGNGRNKKQLKEVFSFPKFKNIKNLQVSQEMLLQQSVAVHVRRSDHMYDNHSLFEDKYFKKATDYIHKMVHNPVFYLFSDEPDWCRENLGELGLALEEVVFIDWNRGTDSYRDMQLMTYCRHNVLVISSFSWWGYYLSKYEEKEKVVCAPKNYWLEVKVHF